MMSPYQSTIGGSKIVEERACSYCGIIKAIIEFPKHSHYKDNLDKRCRDCIKKGTKLRARIKRFAPPKPEVCDCCGKHPKETSVLGTLLMDHDHNTDKVRGWLCNKCNLGIGNLGDNIEGLMKAMEYLKRENGEINNGTIFI